MDVLPNKDCEYCGCHMIPSFYVNPKGVPYWYYEHVEPWDCLKYLRSLIDDIGSRRVV